MTQATTQQRARGGETREIGQEVGHSDALGGVSRKSEPARKMAQPKRYDGLVLFPSQPADASARDAGPPRRAWRGRRLGAMALAGALSVGALVASGAMVPAIAQAHPGRTDGWNVEGATERLVVGRITLRYEPELEAAALSLAQHLPDWWEDLEREFGQDLDDSLVIHLVSHPGTLADASGMPGWAAGVANSPRGEIIISTHEPSGQRSNLTVLARHELAHVALHRAIGGAKVPRWFHEGVADTLGTAVDFGRSRTLTNAVFGPGVPSIFDAEAMFYGENGDVTTAYAASRDFVLFLRARDERAYAEVFERLRNGESFHKAIAGAYNASLEEIDANWRAGLWGRVSWAPLFDSGALPLGLTVPLIAMAWVRRRRSRLDGWDRLEREDQEAEARWLAAAGFQNAGLRVHFDQASAHTVRA